MSIKTIIKGAKDKLSAIHFGKATIAEQKKHAHQKKKKGHDLVGKATKYLWKHSWFQFLGIGAVIAFLLFFLHLFLATAFITQKVSGDITQRLGFYFYINEPGQNGVTLNEDQIVSRVMDMKDELVKNGLETEYYSKEDALKMLQERIPGVIQNFDKYGIANPLPATMYVTFDNNDEFIALSGIVSNYIDIVRNAESLQTKGGFAEQQQRISNIINITNFSTAFSMVLMVVVCAMIIAFLLLIITMKCRQFWKNIEVEKLLGAHYMTIKMPFLISIVLMLLISFIFTAGIVAIIGHYIGSSFAYLFHTSLATYVDSIGWQNIVVIVACEFILLSILATTISDRVLTYMIKEI